MITGKTLIELGYKPSKWFANAIDYANKNNLDNDGIQNYIDNEILSKIPKQMEPLENPIFFHQNILAEDGHDQDNIIRVFSAMNNLLTVPTAVYAAVMPDACPTGQYDIPVGGIIATKNAIHPSMHSADICCSVMATDLGTTDPKSVMDAAFSITHFGAGGREKYGKLTSLPNELKDKINSNPFLKSQKSLFFAENHLGTQGDGNHFLFVGRSKASGRTMLVTHHGSRGFGAALYKQGLTKAQFFLKQIAPKVNSKNAWIPYDTQEGKDYWDALQIVREWTKLNHSTIHSVIKKKVSAQDSENFWNEHNFVFKKDDVFYHAKGATPLIDEFVPDSHNGLRLIPLNMQQPVLVVKGEATENNLGFAPHGAGRNFSRTEHRRLKLKNKTIQELFDEETNGLDVRFFSGRVDVTELPSAYKNADKVKNQIKHFNLGEVVDEIEPYGCIMAGEKLIQDD
jgi:RNA-splicing ligase RtcB